MIPLLSLTSLAREPALLFRPASHLQVSLRSATRLPHLCLALHSHLARPQPASQAGQQHSLGQRPLGRPPLPPPAKPRDDFANLSYFVRRTPSSQLPIYRRRMSGGNRQVTVMKKIDGDRRQMLQDLATSLDIKKDDIRLNPTTQHIEIKGDYLERAKTWLLQHGF